MTVAEKKYFFLYFLSKLITKRRVLVLDSNLEDGNSKICQNQKNCRLYGLFFQSEMNEVQGILLLVLVYNVYIRYNVLLIGWQTYSRMFNCDKNLRTRRRKISAWIGNIVSITLLGSRHIRLHVHLLIYFYYILCTCIFENKWKARQFQFSFSQDNADYDGRESTRSTRKIRSYCLFSSELLEEMVRKIKKNNESSFYMASKTSGIRRSTLQDKVKERHSKRLAVLWYSHLKRKWS